MPGNEETQAVRANVPAPFDVLDDDLINRIFGLLSLAETLKLCKINREFRKFIHERLKYDPFAINAYQNNLGEMIKPGLSALEKEDIQRTAASAFSDMERTLKETMKKASAEVVIRVGAGSSSLKTVSTLKPLSGDRKFGYVNCLAKIRLGESEWTWAVNFQPRAHEPWIKVLRDQLKDYKTVDDYETIEKRHSEMRITEKNAVKEKMASEIDVDKLFCIFCAAQHMALGYQFSPEHWKIGSLQWYTFSPIVIFLRRQEQRCGVQPLKVYLTPTMIRKSFFFLNAL